ncbi:amidohydrolase [Eubacteriaceae bacterium ES3]|nr:amidohydrolase [Eubacteriaceae bacterium ES3]
MLKEALNAYLSEAITVRRDLHQIPEEGFSLFKTRDYILKYLKNLGLSPEIICESGVIVYIKGNSDEENAIAFRADMDALCIDEENEKDYCSKHPGMMHACGHDGHMTMNLLLAKYLVDNSGSIQRSVLLIFQPAEEGPGGAKPMIEAGILEKYPVKAIFGYHLFPFIKEGVLGTRPGPMMAMNSEFFIRVHGVSGHGAEPHLAKDVMIAGGQLIMAMQSIVSRDVDPKKSAVITIGMISGGTRINVIADELKLCGTIRSFNSTIHAMMHKRITEMVRGCELTSGCRFDLEFVDMYPEVYNDETLFEIFKEVNKPEKTKVIEKMMLSEDFSFYQKEIPGLFIGIGSGNSKKGFDKNLHTKEFNFDEKVLLTGLSSSIRFVEYKNLY